MRVCHKRTREVAREAVKELYDELMSSSNELFLEWKRQNPSLGPRQLRARFCEKNWPRCIDFAKKSMALMLADPNLDSSVKDEILEVLLLENSIPMGNMSLGQAEQAVGRRGAMNTGDGV